MVEPKEVPFSEESIGGVGGAGSKLIWILQRGEVGMWALKPLQRHKTIHITGTSTLDVWIEGSNLDHGAAVVLREKNNLEEIRGEGMFVMY